MNLNLNTKNLTGFAKSVGIALGSFAALWATPATHDALVKIIMAYPNGSKVVGVIASLVAVWGVLHNPVKK